MATRPSKNLLLQQATERRHIELFLELAGLVAETEFGDRPDCVLVLAGRRIGLEHRELYDQRVQAHGPHLQRFREFLQGELEARGLDLHVQVQFPALSTYFVAHPRRVLPLAREIADLAAARDDGHTPAVIAARELLTLGIEGPTLVTFQRFEGECGPSVQTQSGPADFEAEGAHRVVEAVRSKEAKLPGYSCDATISRLWLLLVTGETVAQTAIGIENLRIESRFDRVYVLDARDRRLLCVAAG
jgi:hypothetical protein